MTSSVQKDWEFYVESELKILNPLLYPLGFSLDTFQPHIQGERFLMRAITTTSGEKLILLGTQISTNKRVVIKVTKDTAGMKELIHERKCRILLQEIRFAYNTFVSPNEIFFKKIDAYLISIQEYIEQESTFLSRTNKEQGALALRAFKAQESAHATTYGHIKEIEKTFGIMRSGDYLERFEFFSKKVTSLLSENGDSGTIFASSQSFLEAHKEIIEQYSGFLTHTDFVPHNIRIRSDTIYLLDYSSLRFGNKYEGWARFLNFMTLYNPSLERALVEYVRVNRTPEESVSLKIMRIYRLGEIIYYYSKTLSQSTGDLLLLNTARIGFWSEVLKAELANTALEDAIRENYKNLREKLRSEPEKLRQKDLH
jgi:hypothetical protein